MCGILGFYVPERWIPKEARVDAALKSMEHRGPNDKGLEIEAGGDGQIGLGHRRLSIIDLSAGGHQPMSSADGRYTIVYNGEIYNYRELRQQLRAMGHNFLTESDTEVLMAAWIEWGAGCLVKLIGMFAFAMFDREARTLTLVRDAFGIKPLFYQDSPQGFYFASELPTLLILLPKKPQLNLQRAYDYLVAGSYDNEQSTFYADVHHLRPGCWLKVNLDDERGLEFRRWWLPEIEERKDLSFADAVEQLRELFLRNVRMHLRSDVPLGAALSGGVDSSAVVCAMRHLEPDMPIHTFSFVAPGTDIDEEQWIDLINGQVGAIPHKTIVAPDELAEDLDDMIRAQGEPFGSTSIYAQYRVFRLAREHGVTVTLDGQGADEMLAGYSGYPLGYLKSLVDQRDYLAILPFLYAWARWPGRSNAQAAKMFIGVLTPRSLRSLGYRALGRNPAPSWLKADVLADQNVAIAWPASEHDLAATGRRLVEALRTALTEKGLVSLLRHGDRNSMRWSIESRVPFLTTDLAEFLLSLPESYLLSPRGETKHVFRAAMRGIVPDAVLDRRDKIGFQTPERNWLHKQGTRIKQWLEAAETLPFLDALACRQEVCTILEGQRPFGAEAWRLINYCRWAQLQEVAGVDAR